MYWIIWREAKPPFIVEGMAYREIALDNVQRQVAQGTKYGTWPF